MKPQAASELRMQHTAQILACWASSYGGTFVIFIHTSSRKWIAVNGLHWSHVTCIGNAKCIGSNHFKKWPIPKGSIVDDRVEDSQEKKTKTEKKQPARVFSFEFNKVYFFFFVLHVSFSDHRRSPFGFATRLSFFSFLNFQGGPFSRFSSAICQRDIVIYFMSWKRHGNRH